MRHNIEEDYERRIGKLEACIEEDYERRISTIENRIEENYERRMIKLENCIKNICIKLNIENQSISGDDDARGHSRVIVACHTCKIADFSHLGKPLNIFD